MNYIVNCFALIFISLLSVIAHAGEPTLVKALQSDSLVESIGINIHTHYNDTIYNDFSKMKAALKTINVRHVRDGLVDSSWQPYYDRLNELGREGIMTLVIAGNNMPMEKVLPTSTKLRDAIEGFEGPNEIDLARWEVERGRSFQRSLYTIIKNSPDWNDYPVVSLSITNMEYAKNMGELSEWLDFGNAHPYPGGWHPENNCEWMFADIHSGIKMAQYVCKNKPIYATEIGYTNHTGIQGHVAVSEEAAGVYLPRFFLNNLKCGIKRSYWYELFDLHDNPKDQESNFGLYRNDGVTPKPAAKALANLIRIFGDSGKSFTPESFPYRLSCNKAQSMLFQKRNGTFLIALWLNSCMWDDSRPFGQKQEIDPVDEQCTIKFDQPIKAINVYSGLDSTLTKKSYRSLSEIELKLSERIIVIEIPVDKIDK